MHASVWAALQRHPFPIQCLGLQIMPFGTAWCQGPNGVLHMCATLEHIWGRAPLGVCLQPALLLLAGGWVVGGMLRIAAMSWCCWWLRITSVVCDSQSAVAGAASPGTHAAALLDRTAPPQHPDEACQVHRLHCLCCLGQL